MAETEFREQGKASTQHKGQLGKRTSLNTTICEWRKGREGEIRGKGHVAEDIIKTGHGYCEIAV
jgi:hypothetical protein